MATFEVGDEVVVTRKLTKHEQASWYYMWLATMDGLVGKVGRVNRVYSRNAGDDIENVSLYFDNTGSNFALPTYILEPAVKGVMPAVDVVLRVAHARFSPVLEANALAYSRRGE